jgi:hypothetical protein
MSIFEFEKEVPAQFASAALGLTAELKRSELETHQIPSPANIAEHALAFSTHKPNPADTPNNLAAGRIVFLYDPSQFETWGSNMRVIAYGKSPLESDVVEDNDYANYWWGTLELALQQHGALFSHSAGTITKMISTGVGGLGTEPVHTEIELRASWSPTQDNLAPHFAAWQDLIADMAGFHIGGEDVVKMARAK